MNINKINDLMMEYADMELAEVQSKNKGFMARALVIATMPHKEPHGNEFQRINGAYRLVMTAPSEIGLPYGTKPRLIMAFVSTEAVKTKNRKIYLGTSMSTFMNKIGLSITGGPNGSLPRLRDQLRRLMNATVSVHFHGNRNADAGFRISSKLVYFWDNKNPYQESLWESEITLTEEFYKEIIEHPVPINLEALQALKSSSLALDIYMWLTHRVFNLTKPINIPWQNLAFQFGANFQRVCDFKKSFIIQLKNVLSIYPVNVFEWEEGITIKPSLTHISRSL